MAISKIPSAGFQDNVKFRNIIINGDMSIAQRGTSTSGVGSTSGYFAVDRQQTGIANSGTWTVSQSTDTPSGQGFSYSCKYDCTTASASLSADAEMYHEQRFEGQNLQYLKKGTSSAESLTLSFWVKSNKTGTYIFQLNDTDNNRSISKSYTINSASTWEKKTLTFDGDTTGSYNNDNGMSLRIRHWLVAGTDNSSGTLQTSWGSRVNTNQAVGQVNLADSTSNEWYITGVQLEAGEVASDFEFLPHDVNLQRCFRYYRDVYNGGGMFFNPISDHGVYRRMNVILNPSMRAVPTVTITGGTNGTFATNSPNIDGTQTVNMLTLSGDVVSNTSSYSFIQTLKVNAEL